jgi:hypothetical protein
MGFTVPRGRIVEIYIPGDPERLRRPNLRTIYGHDGITHLPRSLY